jgi:hypothetical protein
VLAATSRRGRSIECRVVVVPVGKNGDVTGAVVMMSVG